MLGTIRKYNIFTLFSRKIRTLWNGWFNSSVKLPDYSRNTLVSYIRNTTKFLDGILLYAQDLQLLENLLLSEKKHLFAMLEDKNFPQAFLWEITLLHRKTTDVIEKVTIAINMTKNNSNINQLNDQQTKNVIAEEAVATMDVAIKTENAIPEKAVEVVTAEAYTALKNKYEGTKVEVDLGYLKGKLDLFEQHRNDFAPDKKKLIIENIKSKIAFLIPPEGHLTIKHQELLKRATEIAADITKNSTENVTETAKTGVIETELAIKILAVKLEVFQKLFAQEVIPRMLPLKYLVDLKTQADSIARSERLKLTPKDKKVLEELQNNITISLGNTEKWVYKLHTPGAGSSTVTDQDRIAFLNRNKLLIHAPKGLFWMDPTVI